MVISLVLIVILWAVFHQLASKYVNTNEDLKKNIYGVDIYKNRSMDVTNIELVITAIMLIHVINFFSENALENFFKKRSYLIFNHLNFESSINIIENHSKLWNYIRFSIILMILMILLTIAFWVY